MFTLRFPPWVSFLALLGAGLHSAAVAQVSPAVSVPVIRPLVQVRHAEQPVRVSKSEVRVQDVFEAIVRRCANPALLAHIQGNNYKLRI